MRLDEHELIGYERNNLLREYAGTHYEYDERGNQIQRMRSMNPTYSKVG